MRYFALILSCCLLQAHAQVKYQNDLEKAEVGALPEEFMVLQGDFTVKEVDGNKVLEVPGAPLDTYSVLFGPNARENIAVSARIYAKSKGRRLPVFEVGLNGGGGHKLRASPAKKKLELLLGDEIKTAVPLEWTSGKWTLLKLRVVKAGESEWKVEGKCWQEGETEPAKPVIALSAKEEPLSGKASVSGMPFSGLPIWFDDLIVSAVTP